MQWKILQEILKIQFHKHAHIWILLLQVFCINFINYLSFNIGIFILEAIIKIVALGFLFGKKTYLKNYYNIIDFAIVLISIIGYIFEYTSDSG